MLLFFRTFFSELHISATKPGGFGGNDIWVSQRPTVSDSWGAPVNLGATINTASTEFVPAFSEDGHRMFDEIALKRHRYEVSQSHGGRNRQKRQRKHC